MTGIRVMMIIIRIMNHRKKLIAVALPLGMINKASVREKILSHRHRSAATIAKLCCTEVRV
jgi:hypothetical protein